ncbi:MAG: hypothetical protein HS128_23360 [Ideonella sp.]|nr:hypothetical protein [Ideonella sp.]
MVDLVIVKGDDGRLTGLGQKNAQRYAKWQSKVRDLEVGETVEFSWKQPRARSTVLDPFGGAGTTGLVADYLGRDALLIELNADYISIAQRRIHGAAPLFAEVVA